MKKIVSILVWGRDTDIQKKSIIWNIVFSVLSAVQSAVLTIAASRLAGAGEAGMISIAFAAGYLVCMIAGFGVRNFHVTDTSVRFCYGEYYACRIVTGAVSLAASIIITACQGYRGEKLFCVWCICFLKIAEAFEDLDHGELQRMGRLDAACRLGSVRLAANYAAFFWMLASGRDFLWSVLAMSVQSAAGVLLEHALVRSFVNKMHADSISWSKCRQIFTGCFPLFLTSFFSIYISNSSKYAIDRCMPDEAQAYFAALFMPVFSINLLSGMVYRPQMAALSVLWHEGRQGSRRFLAAVGRQSAIILCIAAAAGAAGLSVGIPVLEVIYGLSLHEYRLEFGMLLAGGGLGALVNYYFICLTIMRRQWLMIGITAAVAAEAFLIAERMVAAGGLMGAAGLYFVLMISEIVLVAAAVGINLAGRKGKEICRK